MRLRTFRFALFGALLLSSGCAAANREALAPVAASPAMAASPPPAEESAATARAPGMAPPASATDVAPARPAPGAATAAGPAQAKTDPSPKLDDAAKPLLVYEGALDVQVTKSELPAAIERAIDVAEGLGGYLVSRTDTGVELRVPSQSFRGALRELGAIGEVTRRSVSAQDVSQEYHDLGVRLKNLEAVRGRLEQFLGRANNVDEALRVGKELENVVRQIDEIKGRMQFLKTRATYSRIVIALSPKPEASKVVVKTGPESPPPARPLRMPVRWLSNVGLEQLLELE